MNESDAHDWLRTRFGQPAVDALQLLIDTVVAENQRQNLISPLTIDNIWVRHVVDSAQLVPLAPAQGNWLDIGTGAGFPGLVAAILRPQPTILIEPRRQRADFLERCAALLDLTHVEVRPAKVETIAIAATVISARAVASVEKLLQAAAGCGTTTTRWLLPRGRFSDADLQALRLRWRGVFHMKQSLTEPMSKILICDGPHRR